ncbi:MAG: DNA-formamidopyrimidine glycosylase [Bacilli bacterium]|nr:DNA-formamidopyrimidine glycosylase [Bacilli bacterium]
MMPEKPEVITVSEVLKKRIIGKTINNVSVYWDNIIATPSVKEFKEKIKNQEILDITTRGKFIVVTLTDYSLLFHLRMEGKFFFRNKGEELNKHEHVVFLFKDQTEMRFHDVRKFGKIYLVDKKDTYKIAPLSNLGYEYNDNKLTPKYLTTSFKNRRLPIKTVLLDQSIITGIGNIYDDEILFLSGINPYKKASELTEKECKDIIDNTIVVLTKAIKMGGTTIKSFTSAEGVHGLFQNELFVHGKKNSLCPKCNTKIENVKIGGRGTYYCPNCQK